MVPVWLVAVALSAGIAAPAAPASEYDFIWTAFAREVRWQQGESQPVAAGNTSTVSVRNRQIADFFINPTIQQAGAGTNAEDADFTRPP